MRQRLRKRRQARERQNAQGLPSGRLGGSSDPKSTTKAVRSWSEPLVQSPTEVEPITRGTKNLRPSTLPLKERKSPFRSVSFLATPFEANAFELGQQG